MLKAYLQLAQAQRHDLHAALWRLIVIRISLLTGIEQTRKRFGGLPDCQLKPMTPAEHPVWEARATAMRRAASRLPDTACLARSLALRWWMRANGIDAECRIGVRKRTGNIESHAWVETDGKAFAESQDVVRLFKVI